MCPLQDVSRQLSVMEAATGSREIFETTLTDSKVRYIHVIDRDVQCMCCSCTIGTCITCTVDCTVLFSTHVLYMVYNHVFYTCTELRLFLVFSLFPPSSSHFQ